MNKVFKHSISVFLVFVLTLSTLMCSFAEGNDNTVYLNITEKSGEVYTIKQTENDTTRSTYLYDENGNLVQTLHLNKIEGILLNPDTGATLAFPELKGNFSSSDACTVFSDKDYEYEFCSLGDSYKATHSVTIGEIISMVGVTTTVSAVAALLISVAGIGAGALVGAANDELMDVAEQVVSLIGDGVSDGVVEMEIRYICQEVWEADYTYPNGGFWFLGYVVDTSYIKAKIV